MSFSYNEEMDINDMLMCEKMEKTPLFSLDNVSVIL